MSDFDSEKSVYLRGKISKSAVSRTAFTHSRESSKRLAMKIVPDVSNILLLLFSNIALGTKAVISLLGRSL